jgi:hypothetical protein
MAKSKFPTIVHVVLENEGQGEDEYLNVTKDGAVGSAEVGNPKKCAVYKLVETGVITATPQFTASKRKS